MTEEKMIVWICGFLAVVVLTLIGGCQYTEMDKARKQFATEQEAIKAGLEQTYVPGNDKPIWSRPKISD